MLDNTFQESSGSDGLPDLGLLVVSVCTSSNRGTQRFGLFNIV